MLSWAYAWAQGGERGNKVQTSISYLRYVILNSVADRGWVPEIYEYLLNFSAEPMERCNEMEIYVRHISQSQRNFAAAQVCRNPTLLPSYPALQYCTIYSHFHRIKRRKVYAVKSRGKQQVKCKNL